MTGKTRAETGTGNGAGPLAAPAAMPPLGRRGSHSVHPWPCPSGGALSAVPAQGGVSTGLRSSAGDLGCRAAQSLLNQRQDRVCLLRVDGADGNGGCGTPGAFPERRGGRLHGVRAGCGRRRQGTCARGQRRRRGGESTASFAGCPTGKPRWSGGGGPSCNQGPASPCTTPSLDASPRPIPSLL